MPLRIGSLCTGYGGLDLAVMDALPGAELAWHAQYDPEDKHQHAARILDHHWPGLPNHGDITRADWFAAEPVDILTAGFPCQPVSLAGHRKGTADARWIWPAVAQCVRLLRPGHVLLENVAALAVRGLADVVADLARIGYVGSWVCLRASDVGAPHRRNRIFILARPAEDPDRAARGQRRLPAPGQAPLWGARPDPGRRGGAPVADAAGDRRHEGRPESARELRGPDAAFGGRPAAADAGGPRLEVGEVEPAGGELAPPERGDRGAGRDFGTYGAVVARWERVTDRAAPAPTDERGRLAPQFVEWMMGLPAGWVTGVPGIPRNAQLKALGNGVVPQQGAAAFRILHERLAGRMPERSAA